MVRLIKNPVNIFQRTIKEHEYRKFLAPNSLVDDVYLVSFPRSGNHWLRFLIANAIKVPFRIELDVNFYTIDGIIPNIHVRYKN